MTLPRTQSRASDPSSLPDEAPRLHMVTFGCQMNKYDSLFVEGRFRAQGYRMTAEMDDADVILFNTCSVRDHAEERVYSWLGELKAARAKRPDLVIGVMGCMAQRAGDEVFSRAGHVDIVCGTRRIQDLPELVGELRERRARPAGEGSPLEAEAHAPRARADGDRTLAVEMDGPNANVVRDRTTEPYVGGLLSYLTVMRGCDLNCTFCIVPTVRGRVRSRPIDELVREARWMVEGGARVLTLLGQTVNAYGEDLPKPGPADARLRGRQGRPGLADLLYALQEIPALERIRLVTLHPSYVTRELARAIRDCDKVDRFLPLPAQSGSDAVLKRMRRGYTTDLYRRRVDLLREDVPDIELGSDWIVGFPGESDEDFQRTLDFLGEIEFAQGYVFQYDPRPGTRAHGLVDDVPRAVKKERNQALLARLEEVALGRHQRWIGRDVRVFVEEEARSKRTAPQGGETPTFLRGRTLHSLPVRLEAPLTSVGGVLDARIEAATAYGLTAVRT